MDIYQEIFAKAKVLMSNELPKGAEDLLYEMCLAAYSELFQRLREEVSLDEIHDQLVRASAALALSMFIGFDTAQLEGYSAGNVTVRRRSTRSAQESARSLRSQAELMLAGCLDEQSFGFRAVRA